MRPPLRATVSLDLDDLWTYLKTRGDARWASYPTYLPIVVPRALALLDELDLKITFFIVGRDAAVPAHGPLMRALADHGHEIGSHSYEHDCWLHLFHPAQLNADLSRAEESIEGATGRRPQGFRGPGFSWSSGLLDVLAERGYRYDASTLPTIVAPLARTYFLWTAHLSAEERKERRALFGSFEDAVRPIKPYRWELPSGRNLLEVPVTTIPGVRIPFHLSYLLYLRSFSWHLMVAYLETALFLCRLYRVEPTFLLHPLDLVASAEAPGLEFFPGMGLSVERKADVFRHALGRIQNQFQVVTLESFARDLDGNTALEVRRPSRRLDAGARRAHGPTAPAMPASHSPSFRLTPPESFSRVDTEV
jgi:peptidoglycan-N-acetylglucosamine deacetylase